MKKVLALFTLSFFSLQLSLSACAAGEPIFMQDQSKMPEEQNTGGAQAAVDANNAILQLMASPLVPMTTFTADFVLGFEGPALQVRVDGTTLKFTDSDGIERTGTFDQAELTGSVVIVQGANRQRRYDFEFKATSGVDSPFALTEFKVENKKFGAASSASVDVKSFKYDANGALIGYSFVAAIGLTTFEVQAAQSTGGFWNLDYAITGDPAAQYYGKETASKDDLGDFIGKSFILQILRIHEKAYMTRVTDKTDKRLQIESYRNPQGILEPTLAIATDADGVKTYLIENPAQPRGLLIRQDQSPAGLGDSKVSFGAYFENGAYKGFGLLIKDGAGDEVHVDFPNVKEVKIGLKTYDISLIATGVLEFKERLMVWAGQVSPYQTAVPANLVQWDLANYPAQDPSVPPVAGGDDLGKIEIYRQNPGSTAAPVLIATLKYMTNQYLDTDVDPDHSLRTGYVYTVYIKIKSGVRNLVPSTAEQINYGRDTRFAEGDLQPKNVLVIASSVNSANGKQKSLLGDGTDLVDYYVNARGIPASNVLRLNVEDDATFSNFNDFKKRVLDPIYNFLVANHLTEQITAFTTMPGAHLTYRAARYQGQGVVYEGIPIESIISDSIPKMIKGEKLTTTFRASNVNNYQPFEEIESRQRSSTKDQADLDALLQKNLGYTRLAAPATATLTAQQNLKRLIDQGIAAEKKAKLAAETGTTADYYSFIFDGTGGFVGAPDITGATYAYGNYRYLSAEKMLRDYGYTTYLDTNGGYLSGANTVTDTEFLADLATGDKKLYGYGGWYFIGNQNNIDEPTDQYNPIYDYLEGLSPDGFADGSFITPLDSGRESGWFALKRDGVVMAVNAQEEPYVDGLANVVGAYVYTGTSLAFASVKAQKFTHWMANVFGDPLFNMGKYILGTPRTSVEDGKTLTTQIVQAGKLEATLTGVDYINGPRTGVIESTYDSTGRIVRTRLSNGGTETYNADGTKIYRSMDGTEILEFDKQGRIVRRTKTVFNPSTQQNVTTVKTFSY